ncbi:hypothetical protein G7K_5388-t1 [Saitoella complicata NRRL Y-17804]|uniref:Probable lysosomal cobalamin transporter n=1 Tax=Saitoella complicata (strain BCRC 22490 / CBS 7301 / JCM 7358 / NBRC 10748 / NRRL Y-17804) TaxID=698492 RepID=A0A0E9NN97_SAICN|nr:hypothetical protein G7K_5388-t1 [Saitoella complicata NRRL Y-17804]
MNAYGLDEKNKGGDVGVSVDAADLGSNAPSYHRRFSERPLETVEKFEKAVRSQQRHTRNPSDQIDMLDSSLFGVVKKGGRPLHHSGPYDAAMKPEVLEATALGNQLALEATPQRNIEEAIQNHVPLDGTAAIPPGVGGMTYTEQDIEQDEGLGQYPGVTYDSGDTERRGQGNWDGAFASQYRDDGEATEEKVRRRDGKGDVHFVEEDIREEEAEGVSRKRETLNLKVVGSTPTSGFGLLSSYQFGLGPFPSTTTTKTTAMDHFVTAVTGTTSAVALVGIVVFATGIVKYYQAPRDRDALCTLVTIIALSSVLATVLLFPVDVALVSNTTDNATGLKKAWATDEKIGQILFGLKVLYYSLYSLDVGFVLLFIPFTYFFYEEWDADSTTGERVKNSLKYSVFFLFTAVVLFLIGFFVPIAKADKAHLDLDYFKKLLAGNHSEKALAFTIGILLTIGSALFISYTAPGLALLPLSLISPSLSPVPTTSRADQALAHNRERQRAIEVKYAGSHAQMNSKDRRALEALQREERTLVRHVRLAEEAGRKSGPLRWVRRVFGKMGRVGRVVLGLVVGAGSVVTVASMIISGIEKLTGSVCGRRCGFILDRTPKLFNLVDRGLVMSSRIFPLDYIITTLLVLLFFMATMLGILYIGIRVLWVNIFRVRPGSTQPQGLLLLASLLTLTILAINYSLVTVVAPQYAHFGHQKFCNHTLGNGFIRDCTDYPDLIVPCDASAPTNICTPTVMSSFVDRVGLNYPFFGQVGFWSQWIFVGVWVLSGLWILVRGVRWAREEDEDSDDEVEDGDEEESLLGSWRRRVISMTEQEIRLTTSPTDKHLPSSLGQHHARPHGHSPQIYPNSPSSRSRTTWTEPLTGYQKEAAKLRQGRQNPALLDNLKIELPECALQLKDVAMASLKDGETMLVSVFEEEHVKPVQTAIQRSPHSLNP